MFTHIPIMPNEVLDAFSRLEKGSLIVDGTIGKGGHSILLLEKGFKVIGIDRDEEAVKEASANLAAFDTKVVHGNFSEMRQILDRLGVEKADGILLDLGVSTYQLESKERGFGFEGNLDMRMDKNNELTAEKIVNEYSFEKLASVLFRYGERVHARQIAESIVKYRQKQRITTGGQLLKLVKYSMPQSYRESRRHHWATPTFRALRMEVNRDFEHIEKFFRNFLSCLRKGGVLCVITFHSLEEDYVRKQFSALVKGSVMEPIVRGLEAGKEETAKNPKAKRAKLWAATAQSI